MWPVVSLVLSLAATLPAAAAPSRPSILVAAAVSLTDALTEAATAYAAAGGGPVRFNFAGSNLLARQIVSGAPVDLFISADAAQMDVVAHAGRIVEGSRVPLLANQLVVVVPDDRQRKLASIADLKEPAFKRIAIGDPDAVPAGVYAKQYLESEGLWEALRSRIVPSANVRAALAAVDAGAADAAIVYRTDVSAAKRATVAWSVPANKGPRIVYPAARIRGGHADAETAKFLEFLQSDAGFSIFERYGFSRAPQGR
jgi:molybdate transport system substrate-binding protein